jgi:hypothetical protein
MVRPRLADLGISPDQSSRWQAISHCRARPCGTPSAGDRVSGVGWTAHCTLTRTMSHVMTRKQRGLALIIAAATILVSLVAHDLWYASRARSK